MKIFTIVFVMLLSGCGINRYVDIKGRDCSQTYIFPFSFDACDTKQEALATTRQEIKQTINADIKGVK